LSNWAYRVMTAVAWNLKGVVRAVDPRTPAAQGKRIARRKRGAVADGVSSGFVNTIILMPCQIGPGVGRRLIYRLLSWNEWQGVFLRVVFALRWLIRRTTEAGIRTSRAPGAS